MYLPVSNLQVYHVVSLCVPLPGVVDVAAEWMSDMKEGWCPSAGYYNKVRPGIAVLYTCAPFSLVVSPFIHSLANP